MYQSLSIFFSLSNAQSVSLSFVKPHRKIASLEVSRDYLVISLHYITNIQQKMFVLFCFWENMGTVSFMYSTRAFSWKPVTIYAELALLTCQILRKSATDPTRLTKTNMRIDHGCTCINIYNTNIEQKI